MELTVKVRVGVHVSISGSIDRAVDRAVELGCGTFQMFTRNPRGWHAKPLGEADLVLFRRKLAESSIVPAVAHMPYLPNLASAKID
jgi:deoxyribonuclease-4